MKQLILTEYDLNNMETVLGEEKDQIFLAQGSRNFRFPEGEQEQIYKLEGIIDFIKYNLRAKLKEVVLESLK